MSAVRMPRLPLQLGRSVPEIYRLKGVPGSLDSQKSFYNRRRVVEILRWARLAVKKTGWNVRRWNFIQKEGYHAGRQRKSHGAAIIVINYPDSGKPVVWVISPKEQP